MTVLAALLALAATPAAFQGRPNPEDLATRALATAELSPERARFDATLLPLFRQEEFTTPLYSALYRDPWRIPAVADARRRELLAAAPNPAEVLNLGAGMAGFGTRRSLVEDPIAYADPRRLGSLEGELAAMRRSGLLIGRAPAPVGVPPEAKDAAAILIEVARRTVEMRRLALAGIGDPKRLYSRLASAKLDDLSLTASSEIAQAYRTIRPAYFAAAANDLALAMKRARDLVAKVPKSVRYSYRANTQWGWIRLSGGSNDAYPDEPNFVTLDTGGNDVYVGAASTASATAWVSLVLDTNGDDVYLSDSALARLSIGSFANRTRGERPGPAGAVMGVSILWDTEGDDLYRTSRPGLASARAGAALLVDEAGSDRYESFADGEGFASFGVAALVDLAGNDAYSGFTQVQGVGYVSGAGILLDAAGSDRYVAEAAPLDFPSAQDAKLNVSMAQGAGVGRRADYLDGLSFAGGVGVLVDGAGDDAYSASVFAQGVGFWLGTGMLLDAGGKDTYEAQWYAQGASAHFAVGVLDDAAGDDVYSGGRNMAQGAGHDFGVGALVDRAGNDRYAGGALTQGAGNANGIGYLLDLAGDDEYAITGTGQGFAAEAAAGTLRATAFGLGLLADGGGRDRFGDGGESRVRGVAPGEEPARGRIGIRFRP